MVNSKKSFVFTYKNHTDSVLERIKSHDNQIGYMGVITDYLLFEKNGDYHLKLYITTWDYDKYRTEVKYINYIFTYGYEQFFRFCMDFTLFMLDSDSKYILDFDQLLGAYCVVNYYDSESDSENNKDNIENVLPVIYYGDYYSCYDTAEYDISRDMWSSADYITTFADVEIKGAQYDFILLDGEDKDDFIFDYFTYINDYGCRGYRARYIFRKDNEELVPQTAVPNTADVFDLVPHYHNINKYEIVTEYDPESDIDLGTTEPPIRKSFTVYSNVKLVDDSNILL